MSPKPVTVVISYRARADRAEQAATELAALIAVVVAKEPDCFWIKLYRDPLDPTRILLIESWTTREAFQGPHLQTPHLKAFVARAGELWVGPPETSYWDLAVEVPEGR